jgi:hypothetical protein
MLSRRGEAKMTAKPFCFVLMPFGIKDDPTGRARIDFDRVYQLAIKPAIAAAGMVPIRADEDRTGGILHKPMFERLLLCEYAVADLTTANANVFYELGVRHTARPCTTVAIFASHQPIPLDVAFLKAIPYQLGPNNAFGDAEANALADALTKRLVELDEMNRKGECVDSPLFQLVGEWKPPDLARLKTDVFRDRVEFNEAIKQRATRARGIAKKEEAIAELEAIRREAGGLDRLETGVLIDLMLSYRAIGAWREMIELVESMPPVVARQVMVREQYGFALNREAGSKALPPDERAALRRQAIDVLESVVTDQGASSETCGLLGRIYKDLWEESRETKPLLAEGHLDTAIRTYVRGFEADWRDAYPGINAVTLLDIRGDAESKQLRDRLLPVVRFSVEQRLNDAKPDYWDHATMLELSVLASDASAARRHLRDALVHVREHFEPETTARNLRLIAEARRARGEDVAWIEETIAALTADR